MVLNKYEKCKEANENAIDIIIKSKSEEKNELIEDLS